MKVMDRKEALVFLQLGGSLESVMQNVVNALALKISVKFPDLPLSNVTETAKHMVLTEMMELLENPGL